MTMPNVSFQSDYFTSAQSSAVRKFGLYLKAHELQQARQLLETVQHFAPADRQAWLSDHEELVAQVIDGVVNDAAEALDGLHLDKETMKLSMDFVINLREMVNAFQHITYQPETSS
jgi:hypothetical protein